MFAKSMYAACVLKQITSIDPLELADLIRQLRNDIEYRFASGYKRGEIIGKHIELPKGDAQYICREALRMLGEADRELDKEGARPALDIVISFLESGDLPREPLSSGVDAVNASIRIARELGLPTPTPDDPVLGALVFEYEGGLKENLSTIEEHSGGLAVRLLCLPANGKQALKECGLAIDQEIVQEYDIIVYPGKRLRGKAII